MGGFGKSWASASARTLARRRRREWRSEQGHSWASAAARRAELFRVALLEHWYLSSSLGVHFVQMADAIEAMRLVCHCDGQRLAQAQEAKDAGNWSKHSPPPGGLAKAPLVPPAAVHAPLLEEFRFSLYAADCAADCFVLDGGVAGCPAECAAEAAAVDADVSAALSSVGRAAESAVECAPAVGDVLAPGDVGGHDDGRSHADAVSTRPTPVGDDLLISPVFPHVSIGQASATTADAVSTRPTPVGDDLVPNSIREQRTAAPMVAGDHDEFNCDDDLAYQDIPHHVYQHFTLAGAKVLLNGEVGEVQSAEILGKDFVQFRVSFERGGEVPLSSDEVKDNLVPP